ncbi:hypothetical protein C8Q70DRAFT_925265, partial [Cubamyces menziesii]
WQEEAELLPEEMRRVLVTMKHEVTRWERFAEQIRTDVSAEIQEGMQAYASCQAQICRAMRDTFRNVCYDQYVAA